MNAMKPARMLEMTALGADWWNDSGVPQELAEAVALGAVGGTSNPVIVFQAVRANPGLCLPILDSLIAQEPRATEDELAWKLIAVLGRESAKCLLPVFEATKGAKGFLSMQVNPKFYLNPERMVEQGSGLATIAPNIAIKIPATEMGIKAMEELTARGIRCNATVSFSVSQALSVATAFERGLRRAAAAGFQAEGVRPYITLMIGRVDDQLKRVAEVDKITIDPAVIDWAGIAVFKHAHQIFKSRRLPGTLLAAAYRHAGHWSQIIGPEVLQTIPYSWWTKFNASETAPALTLERPVDDDILKELRSKLPDFVRAHDEGAIQAPDFIRYGATVHTLHQFIGGYSDLLSLVRARMLP